MKTKHLLPEELTLSPSDVYAAMRYGGAAPDPEVAALVERMMAEALLAARPAYACDTVPAALLDRGCALIGGARMRVGGIIGSYLEGMTHACVFVATAGAEFEAWRRSVKENGDILGEYVADSIGTVIAEACVEKLGRDLSEEDPRPHSLPYSPGYCAWDIREQRLLFPLLPPRPCGVSLSESCLMHPEKSVSGFFALGENLVPQPYRCEVCTNKSCYKNRSR